ncbi:MAG: hypothetical protein J2P22_15520 [Nocardioides sp.]|nr:hypothetical protein [Nocardioides sp.]
MRIGIAAIEIPRIHDRRIHDRRCTAVTGLVPASASEWDADDIPSNGAETPSPTTGRSRSESPALVSPVASELADSSVCRPTTESCMVPCCTTCPTHTQPTSHSRKNRSAAIWRVRRLGASA